MVELNPKIAFEFMIESYLDGLTSIEKNKIPELEVRFGTGNPNNNQNIVKAISKIDSDNVVKQLYNAGFTCESKDGQHLLRITPDTSHINKNNETKKSKVRLEIVGFDMIQSYCQHAEDLREILKLPRITTSTNPSDFVKFTLKSDAQVMDKYLPAVAFKDFGFNVSYQIERNSDPHSNENNEFLSHWNDLKKTYRYINRVKFCHPEYPINADISIIQASKKSKDNKYISEFTMHDANIFDNEHTYEIELEIDNSRMARYDGKTLLTTLRKCIRTVLSGLQQSNYPIGYTEKTYIVDSYLKLVHGTNYNTSRKIETKDFIGPNSTTLQIDNIIPLNSQSSLSNIRKNYSVTDKADGMRALLYISDNGRIYTIDTNMNVMFTGAIIETKDINGIFQNSLLDGEFIKYNKYGKIINLFAAFDIYYINKSYVGGFDFQSNLDDGLILSVDEKPKTKYRYDLLKRFISELKIISIAEGSNNVIDIVCKHFAFSSAKKNIFAAAKEIQSNVFDEYEKDGLIFTPTNTGVGGSKESLKSKITWQESFKWKPPLFNTIDFLIKIQKDDKGQEAIHNIYVDGTNLQGSGKSIIQYKKIELMCGYTKNHDGYLNPMLELLNGITPPVNENAWEYKPVNFYPTNPADESACFCNVVLHDDVLKTEDGEFFEGDTIVEFRYDLDKKGFTNDNAWKWVPIRNRHDKTTELRNALRDKMNGKHSKPNYGNSYKVANSNWNSIHNPITESMITTGENIQSSPTDNGVYYNKTNANTNTRGLRDFHNLYVKRKLILGCSLLVKKDKKTLIDYAVGKGGDLPKWIDARISFVFGIDVKRDNIHNQLDGACSRYLNEKKRNPNIYTKALFVVGNSELNIRDNSAYEAATDNTYEVQISNAVFGVGNNDLTLWKSVSEQFDVAKKGFDISSIQFALHYFFKDLNMVHQFMRNVSECTSLGGYFTGTCYDGKVIFDKLKVQKNKGTSGRIVIITKDKTKKILEITQNYEQTSFAEDEPCVGYKIDVWQESINKTFTEYLVNFKYVIRLMNNYGFDIISSEEAKKINMPNGTGLFDELYNFMVKSKENRNNFGNAEYMSQEEKNISFMNRYFIFKKIRNIENTKIIQKVMNEELDEEPIQQGTSITAKKLNKTIFIKEIVTPVEITQKPVEDVPIQEKITPETETMEKTKIRIKVKKQKNAAP